MERDGRPWSDMFSGNGQARICGQSREVEKDGRAFVVRHGKREKTVRRLRSDMECNGKRGFLVGRSRYKDLFNITPRLFPN